MNFRIQCKLILLHYKGSWSWGKAILHSKKLAAKRNERCLCESTPETMMPNYSVRKSNPSKPLVPSYPPPLFIMCIMCFNYEALLYRRITFYYDAELNCNVVKSV